MNGTYQNPNDSLSKTLLLYYLTRLVVVGAAFLIVFKFLSR